MVKVAAFFPQFQFVVAGVNSIDKGLYRQYLDGSAVPLIFNQTYDLLNHAHTALVASGTAALETALFNVPQTVVYRVEGGWPMDFVMRNFVIKTIGVSLPNIVMNEEIVVELIQKKMTLKNVKAEMQKLLFDENYRRQMKENYRRLSERMGGPGCSQRAAQKIVEMLRR
jgi:lipid-A-disaccharide synthase